MQPAILRPVPPLARYLTFSLLPDAEPRAAIDALSALEADETLVIGLGEPLIIGLGTKLEGLQGFPALSGPGVEVPSTQHALWCWIRGTDRGHLLHRGRELEKLLSAVFHLEDVVDAFKHGGGEGELGKDLTGYEDGTENPTGDDAVEAGIVRGKGAGMDGSSFVAVQQWKHDLDRFQGMPQGEQDHVIGRRKSDNEELGDAPESAHVKRTAQESYSPEAFVVRQSMPWADATGEGLIFVAFGKSLAAFDALLRRMVGLEDGVPDALFRFTRPLTGGYYWCPPLRGGKLDLTALRS